MSISQTTPEESSAGHSFCPHCNAALPPRATFCGSCGERVKRKKQAPVFDEQDIHTRYRITTLVRRRPSINLYFAQDNVQPSVHGQPRMVAIRDIEMASLGKEARAEAIAQAQQEYDRLRRWHIPHILTGIEMRVFQSHLFLITGMPFLPRETASSQGASRLYTLQDFLQSGQGLPKEARALAWTRSLSQAVDRLHRQQIVLGDLDPYTIVLNKNSAEAEPRLMVSWIPPELKRLLPAPAENSLPQVSYFSAPEALVGEAAVHSDVYSLGALLYLLLTGTPPDESTLRHRRRLRSPRELNARVSVALDECVMQALALDPKERFANVTAFLEALEGARLHLISSKMPGPLAVQPHEVNPAEAETVRIIPLSQKDMARWRAARERAAMQHTQMMPIPPSATPLSSSPTQVANKTPGALPTTPYPGSNIPDQRLGTVGRDTPPPAPAQKLPWKERLTGILPAFKPEFLYAATKPLPAQPVETTESTSAKKKIRKKKKAMEQAQAERPALEKTEPQQVPTPKKAQVPASKKARPAPKPAGAPVHESDASLLKQMQRMILGEQQHTVEAAAIVETPMRVRPDQTYNLRLHLVGRDTPTPHPQAKKGEQPAGLSALVHGETVQVEVRSVLQQGYTYILQQVSVTIPAQGYAAEVTIPMQPQASMSPGRRERLHVFFLDSQRRPLYERPFVVEVFISPLVQLGREGHQVLTIPI